MSRRMAAAKWVTRVVFPASSSPRLPRWLASSSYAAMRGYSARSGGGGSHDEATTTRWGGMYQAKGAFRKDKDGVFISLSKGRRGHVSVHPPKQPRVSMTARMFAGYFAGLVDATGRFVPTGPDVVVGGGGGGGDAPPHQTMPMPHKLEIELHARDVSLAFWLKMSVGYGKVRLHPERGVVVYECAPGEWRRGDARDVKGLAYVAWLIQGRLMDQEKSAQLDAHVLPMVRERMLVHGGGPGRM